MWRRKPGPGGQMNFNGSTECGNINREKISRGWKPFQPVRATNAEERRSSREALEAKSRYLVGTSHRVLLKDDIVEMHASR